jgi:5-methylcytosine-specific restriction protein A
MPFNLGLKQREILTNEEICSVFKCSPQGGMRRSHQTGTLIIVSDHSTIFYDDKWDGDILRYTGMGQTGDQKLEARARRTRPHQNRSHEGKENGRLREGEALTHRG